MSKSILPPPASKNPAPAPNWLEIPAPAIAPEVSDLLTQIDTFTAGKLPRLGLLRFNAKLAKIELVELVKSHGETSRKSFENAKPFADVLAAIGSFLPESAYNGLTYREARELSAALAASKGDAVIHEKLTKRLKASKFGKDWAGSLAKLAAPASETPASETPASETPASETPASETPASETPPAIVAMPNAAPMTAIELVELVKSKLRAMTDKQRDAARSMLASLVNEPAKLAERIAA